MPGVSGRGKERDGGICGYRGRREGGENQMILFLFGVQLNSHA